MDKEMEKTQNFAMKVIIWMTFISMIAGIFIICIPSVSAFGLTTGIEKVVSEDLKTIEIWDGNIITPDIRLGTLELKTEFNQGVGVGYVKVFEYEIRNFYEDTSNMIGELEFYNIRNGMKPVLIDLDLKYKVVTNEKGTEERCDIIDLKLVCKDVAYDRNIITWEDYTPKTIIKGETITISGWTTTKEGDNIEWIPTLYSERIEEWASWDAGIENGVISFWEFDELTGTTAYDNVSTNNMITNETVGQAGKIGTAYEYDASDSQYTFFDEFPYASTGSASWWVYFDSTANGGNQLNAQLTGGIHCQIFNANWYCAVNDGSFLISADAPSTETWYHMVMTWDGSNERLYKNGLNVANLSEGTSTSQADLWYGTGTFDGKLDQLIIWNRAITPAEVIQLYNGGDGIPYLVGDTAPNVTSISPVDEYNSTITDIELNCIVTDNQAVSNMTFWVGGIAEEVNTSGVNGTYLYTHTFSEGTTAWFCQGVDNASQQTNSSARNVNVDTTNPTLSATYNLTNLTVLEVPINSTWHYNATDTHIDDCYYNTTDHATEVITCNDTIYTEWATGGEKSITYCANDTFGFETCDTETITIYYITYDQDSNIDNVAEGFEVVFNLTLSLTDIPTSTAQLNINNTLYNPTTITAGTDEYYFEVEVTIPDGWGNTTGIIQGWFWNYTIDGIASDDDTTTETINVYELNIDNCSVFGDVILNLTLYDEELATEVNQSLGSNIEIDLRLISQTNSSIYVNYNNTWTDESDIAICIPENILDNSEYQIDFTIGFDSTDRVWEFYYIDDGTLDNTNYFNSYTTHQIGLYNLATADSTTFLFSFSDEDGLIVDEAIVHTFRKYIGEGLFREVERSRQDNNGDTHVHLVEEDVIYYFMITQYGEIIYTSDTYNAKCLSTPCAIELSASPTSQNWSIIDNEGGKYAVLTDKTTRIVSVDFLLDKISRVNATVYRFNNGTEEIVNQSYLTATSGSIDLFIPLAYDNSTFFVAIYNNDTFVKSKWVSLEEGARDYFETFGVILAGLIVLSLMLMSVSEGAGFVIFTILALIVVVVMQLVDLGWMALISIICAGFIIIWKLISRRNIKQ